MVPAHSGSWQVVASVGLMLIGAALQWANKVTLIGGQGDISRTPQAEASAALLRNCKQTHTYAQVLGQIVASVLLSSSHGQNRMPGCFQQRATLSFRRDSLFPVTVSV